MRNREHSGGRGVPVVMVALSSLLSGCLPLFTLDVRIEWPAALARHDLDALERRVRGEGGVDDNPALRTPEVETLVGSRKGRVSALSELLDKGVLGEGKDGRLVFDPAGGGGLTPEGAGLARLENEDRERLIAEVSRLKSLEGSRDLGRIWDVFAGVLQDRAAAGWWVQDPDGQWARKGPGR